MGILPFDDWFYNLSYRRQEVMQLHRQVLDLESDILGREAKLKSDYSDLQRMTAFNGVLAMALQAATLEDADWRELKKAIAPGQPKPASPEALDGDAILQELTALLGSAAALQAQKELQEAKLATSVIGKLLNKGAGRLVSPAVKSAVTTFVTQFAAVEAEGAVEGVAGEATLLGIEASTYGTVASTGIGIVIGLGIDMIFSAITGAIERDELDKQIGKLNDAISGLDAFKDKQTSSGPEIDKAIAGQRASLASLLAVLVTRDHPDFDTTVDPASAAANAVLELQRNAVRRYGQLYVLRSAVGSAVARNSSVTADAILDAFRVGGPIGVTRRQLVWYWDILAAVDPSFSARHPSPDADFACSAIDATVSTALSATFRTSWITPVGQAGASGWSTTRLLGQTESFDLAALNVPDGAQIWVEAQPLAMSKLAALAATRYDRSSSRRETFSLKGSLVHASVVREG